MNWIKLRSAAYFWDWESLNMWKWTSSVMCLTSSYRPPKLVTAWVQKLKKMLTLFLNQRFSAYKARTTDRIIAVREWNLSGFIWKQKKKLLWLLYSSKQTPTLCVCQLHRVCFLRQKETLLSYLCSYSLHLSSDSFVAGWTCQSVMYHLSITSLFQMSASYTLGLN